MKIKEIVLENQLTEDLSNFTSVGIPAEFAKNILRKFKIDHDTKIEPVEGKPKNADIEEGNVIINLLPNGDVLALLKRREHPRFSASYNEYYRLELVDGEFKSTRTTKISDATKGMTARGKFFRISSQSIRFFDPYRDKKPTPDEIKDRSTDDPLAGQTIDIYNYMDKVFMPKMRQQMEAMVDDIYANLRKLSKERRWRGDRNQQEQALAAAAAIEKIAEEGFTGNSMEQFLATFGKRHGGFASIPRNESELKKLLKTEPNARAKWAKIILRAAKDEHERVKEMVREPVMRGLRGEGMSEAATAGATSAGNIAAVANPHISPGKARGKKSYTGSIATGSGTKSPPQPKGVQKKNPDGTAKGAHELKGVSLFGAPLKR